MDDTQTINDEAHQESSLHGPQNTQLDSTALNLNATVSSSVGSSVDETSMNSMASNSHDSNDLELQNDDNRAQAHSASTMHQAIIIDGQSIVQTTLTTTSQEIITSGPNGSNDVMSNRNQRKRKTPQSSNLLAVENRAPRTIKPVDEYDKFRNHLVKALEEGRILNCHHEIRTKLWKLLLEYIEKHPVKLTYKNI